MHARVVLGLGKGVLFREVSSVQGCPYRGVPLNSAKYTCMSKVSDLGWHFRPLQILLRGYIDNNNLSLVATGIVA